MTVRYFVTLLLWTLVSTHQAALAGDFADRNILGFSADGRFFAFEQFGRQDGSGFPYADLIILDTRRNKWVRGAPFRTLLFDEKASIDQARAQSKKKAASLLSQMMFQPRGKTLLSNPKTELTSPYKAIFKTQPENFISVQPYKIKLTTSNLKDQNCTLTQNNTKGLTLSLVRLDGAQKKIYLAKESQKLQLKRLRGCTSDYKIADVLFFDPQETVKPHKDQAVLIIMLHIVQQGFEGNDGRFLALSYTGSFN